MTGPNSAVGSAVIGNARRSFASMRMAHQQRTPPLGWKVDGVSHTPVGGSPVELSGRTPRSISPHPRSVAAALRDEVAQRRDDDAARADEAAELRERAAHAADDTLDHRAAHRSVLRLAAVDRQQAARERLAAAADRRHAHEDRAASMRDRAAASLDDLTGALRRESGMTELAADLNEAQRTGKMMVLGYIDVDKLKTINDRYGHSAGDTVLRAVTEAVRAASNDGDPVVRAGGDEFVFSTIGVTRNVIAERLDAMRRALTTAHGASVTFGLAEAHPFDTVETLMARADSELYDARDRTQSRQDGHTHENTVHVKASHVQAIVTDSASLEQAKGILMATMKVTADEAFSMLSDRSQRHNTVLIEVALRLIDTTYRH